MKTTDRYSAPEPTEAEIQHAAYLLWLEDGRPENRDIDHWFAAKEYLSHHHGRSSNPTRRRTRSSAKTAMTANGKN
jgi:hypothetical protein